MDVIALAQAGFGEAVAPLGTALTEAQLERLWRMVDVPILCFDGDAAGQKAAIRAAHRALPMLAPGPQPGLRHAARRAGPRRSGPRTRAPRRSRRCSRDAQPLVDRLWAHELAAEPLDTPEQRAGLQAAPHRAAPRRSPIATSAPNISPNSAAASTRTSRRRAGRSCRTRRSAAQRKNGRWTPPRAPVTAEAQGRPRRRDRSGARQGGARRADPPSGRNRPPYGGARLAQTGRRRARAAVRGGGRSRARRSGA